MKVEVSLLNWLGQAPSGEVSSKISAPVKKKEEPKVVKKPKEDTTGKVDLKKEKGGYGLGLVGGSDTPLVSFSITPASP